MGQILYQVDAFTDKPYSGNPAGVCVLHECADEAWMQNIASEMNLSETAYLYPVQNGFNLRWFTPAAEVDLCGHATLSSAHILWEMGVLRPEEPAVFHTKSGELVCRQCDGWIEMDFPAMGPKAVSAPEGLLDAIGTDARYVGRNRDDFIVEVESEQIVRELVPDYGLLRQLDVRGVIVTAAGDDPEVDFVSRFFAPAVGVNEDPVTGSAHCCLTPYWADKLGKSTMAARQLSTRGGGMYVELHGERVRLRGQAVTVMRIELLI